MSSGILSGTASRGFAGGGCCAPMGAEPSKAAPIRAAPNDAEVRADRAGMGATPLRLVRRLLYGMQRPVKIIKFDLKTRRTALWWPRVTAPSRGAAFQ